MDNLEWLKNVKKADDDWNRLHNFTIENLVKGDEGNEYRMVKALEIIAEALISIDNRMQSKEAINVDVKMS